MNLFLVLLFQLIILCLYNKCLGQEDVKLNTYEFKIFKNGKPIVTGKNETVKGYYFNHDSDSYVELNDSCHEKDKFCYQFKSTSLQTLLLKIYIGKDSMLVNTNCSFDSLQFKPGEYYYSYSYSYLANIISSEEKGSILPGNLQLKNLSGKKPQNYPWENKQIRSLKIFDPEILKIDPLDHTIYAIQKDASSYQLHLSIDSGETWVSYSSRYFNDRPLKICFTEQGNYIEAIRNNSTLYFPLMEYFSTSEVNDTLFNQPVTCIFRNEDIRFDVMDINETQREDDTCSNTILVGGNSLFQVKGCNAKYFDSWDKKMKYLSVSNPQSSFDFHGQKVIVFKYFLLYSKNSKDWFYFPKSDFYSIDQQNRPKYNSDSYWVKGIYWLEGKGLFAHLDDTRLFIINVINK